MPKPRRKLKVNQADLHQLRGSGLSDETIHSNRLFSENGKLVFPYHDLDGEPTGFERYRLRNPDPETPKYLQAKASGCHAYIPAGSRSLVRDGQSSIILTEGEKKALAIDQAVDGFGVIALGGVYSFTTQGTDELIESLREIPWSGRSVYICFDYDSKEETRDKVLKAAQRLAACLRRAGVKEVFCVELPPGPDDDKQGADDFIVNHGAQELLKLIDSARPVPPETGKPLSKPEGRTDNANASRLVTRYGSSIRWVGPWDKFLIWDGHRWKIDQSLRIEDFAKRVAKRLWKDMGAEIAGGRLKETVIKSMLSFVKSSNNLNGVRAMVAMARSEPGVPISVDDLDSDPLLLNVNNGTIDLRDMSLRKHRRQDFITKLAPVAYDPKARCPLWEEFLRTIFDDNQDLIGYMQRLCGYTLAGVTEDHILPFLYGTGANGKSTLVETKLKLLGPDYSMKGPPDLLMSKRGESHPTERADLLGKRFVACVETEDGRRLAEALVKELTGGDRVRARRMREDFWEFTPTHRIWLVGNYKPRVIGTDHGIWRRIKLIPFEVVIPDAEQDKKLPAKLADEMPGILNWMLQGCLEWQQGGLQEPAIISEATGEYAEEMDELGQFLNEYCEFGDDFKAPATELYKAFQEATGSRMSQHSFGGSLSRREFQKCRITSGPNKAKHAWKGLRLRSVAERDRLSASFNKALQQRRETR